MKGLIKSVVLLTAYSSVLQWSKINKKGAIKQQRRKDVKEARQMKRKMLLTGVLHTLAGILYND